MILPNAQKRPYFRFFLFGWVTLPFQQEMRLNQKIEKNNYAMVEINVDKFYSNRAYYPFIPGSIFQALENAYLSGKETAFVSEDEYNVMMSNINASLCPGQ
ncbi:unknown [Bacteroides uniformis CAG:3]|nr:unknown [Bacteroides uniformis CAG:3]